MNLAKECKAASEKLSKLDVCTSDVRYAIRILREAAETLEAAETPREPSDLVKRLSQTQCCDPVIDGLLVAAKERIEQLETPREQGECAARKALKALVARLDLVHEDERYKSVWMLDMIHGGNYTGPKYEDELNLAKSVLCQPCHSSMTRDAVAKLAESTFRKLSDLEEHRCVICHWPLAGSIAEGCIPGNCSYRPGEYSPEWHVMKNRHKHLQIIADALLAANQPERRGE